eukprot:TRINITY_DN22051_c0_g1_i2.p1 TRINITY_DN22051_c0_g1~~TRINITY_DN22051_c0_g1_i2.p1  ORF type:complete len:367 (-),score=52.18 TRINITY_DN22051_c0_g1_i2:83-1183(-)
MCLEAQYQGIENGYLMGFAGSSRSATVAWPYADVIFQILEFVFGISFSAEVVIKILALKKKFIFSAWNWFDTVIILFWMLDTLSAMDIGLNPMFLRLARLARLLRLLRFVRAFQVFDVLWLLIESTRACASVLLWSLVLLFLCMVVSTVFLNYVLQDAITNPENTPEDRARTYEYFGTFTRGLLSMYEITMGNYANIARHLHENVSEWYLPLVLGYRCLVSFALIKVISGIFLHETFKTAASNDEIMIMQRDRAMQRHVRKMHQLFKEADESGDGYLTFEEFQNIVADQRISTWLAAQEIEVRDVGLVYQLVASGRNAIQAEDLVVGFARLKGPARSIDVIALHASLAELSTEMHRLKALLAADDM